MFVFRMRIGYMNAYRFTCTDHRQTDLLFCGCRANKQRGKVCDHGGRQPGDLERSSLVKWIRNVLLVMVTEKTEKVWRINENNRIV